MTVIRAAGGALWRPNGRGVEVCVVHRPRYDDWSLPKGKLEPGEHPLVAAVREIHEETGLLGQPQVRLPSTRYRARDGEAKTVDYWSVRVLSDVPFEPNDEVDKVVWVPVATAIALVTYQHDVDVLTHFDGLPRVTATLALLRHAHAGKRGSWTGPDDDRPLNARGRREADALATLTGLVAPTRLVSATPVRCVRTLRPLAERLGLPIEIDAAFAEPGPGVDPAVTVAGAARRLRSLAATGGSLAIASQGKVIPGLLAELTGVGTPHDWTTPKGTGWLLAFHGRELVAAGRLTPN